MKFGITFVTGNVIPSYSGGKVIYGSNQKHTFDDWGLIPAKRPVVPYPEVKEQRVEVEAIDGDGIDLTEALTGYPLFKEREFEIQFYRQRTDNWSGEISNISNWIHGKKIKMILDDDPMFYYTGRCTVKEAVSDKYWSTITFYCKLEPYKSCMYSSDDSSKEMLWDLLDFDEIYQNAAEIYEWKGYTENGVYKIDAPSVTLDKSSKPYTPVLQVIDFKVTKGIPPSDVFEVYWRPIYRNTASLSLSTEIDTHMLYTFRCPPKDSSSDTAIIAMPVQTKEKWRGVEFSYKFKIIYRKGEF